MRALATDAMQQAYAPYSKFQVGVCICTLSGQFYLGCNVENASYSLTQCAEASAIGTMVTTGEQEISEVVIVSSGESFCAPCGACRQRLLEFATAETKIILFDAQGNCQMHTMAELLPHSFSKHQLID